MTKPERNHGVIHTVLKQPHRGSVTKYMRRYPLSFQGGADEFEDQIQGIVSSICSCGES
jgi:hypothetical protein